MLAGMMVGAKHYKFRPGLHLCASVRFFHIHLFLFLFCSPNKVEVLTKQMIGYHLSTKQTPQGGVKVHKVRYYLVLNTCVIWHPMEHGNVVV